MEKVCQAIANSIKYDRADLRGKPNISAFCVIIEKSKFKSDCKVLKALGTSYSVYKVKEDYIWVQKPVTRFNKEEYEMVKAAFKDMQAIASAECNI